MAEVYGEKPKKFTKKWWSYFWCYYKWWVIVPVFLIVIAIGLTIHMLNMKKFDLTLTYAGPHYFPGNYTKEISAEYSKLCPDVNKDKKNKLNFANSTIPLEGRDFEYMGALMESLKFSIEEDEKYVFIIHKNFAGRFTAQTPRDSRYTLLEDWLTVDIGDKETFCDEGGNAYGVSLAGSKIFEKWDCDLTDHYLFISKEPSDKSELGAYRAAIEFANKLLEN